MAKAKNSAGSNSGQGSGMGFVLALVVLTVLGGGAGGLFGMQMNAGAPAVETEAKNAAEADARGEAKSAPKHGEAAKGEAGAKSVSTDASGVSLILLDPIFANLAEPDHVWMRLEAALMIKADVEERDVLVAKVSQDLMQYLRTVKLAQLEDASGLQFLRDDLNDIVRNRSEGQITELLVKGLIVE